MEASICECLEVLNANPKTASLVVSGLCNNRHQESTGFTEAVVARSLRFLTLHTENNTIPSLLGQLVAPTLYALSLNELMVCQPLPQRSLLSFISRSNCSASLEKLSLTYDIMEGGNILRVTPSLVMLELNATELASSTFQVLTRNNPLNGVVADSLLPNLERLVFRGGHSIRFSELLGMLKSRWYIPPLENQVSGPPTRLKSVYVRILEKYGDTGLEDPIIRSGFRQLQAEGMDIELMIAGTVIELGPMLE